MQSYFYDLADDVARQRVGSEVIACSFVGETSDFVRFNQAAVRQAGRVTQRQIAVELIRGQRHARHRTTLSGELENDRDRLRHAVRELRDLLDELPDDPYLSYATEVHSSERHGQDLLPPARETVPAILDHGRGTDMVGIYAAGGIFNGFANSFGQRNWHSAYSYNLDWSLYHQADKAVKCSLAGFSWAPTDYEQKMEQARVALARLAQPARTIAPGHYRVYLTPEAVRQVLMQVAWRGFGQQDHQTRRTCLLRLVENQGRLHPDVHLTEDTENGTSPNFQSAGFIRPARVALIESGCFRQCLTSPRSAREYGVPTNGANDTEQPESIDMAPGRLPADRILSDLDTGILISNLWYLNYSDPGACRITGMTRFATFWVENGHIEAPLNVMRFDETLYRMLGDNLVGLSSDRAFLLNDYTYDGRSTSSYRLPGALVEDFAFTL